MTKKTKAPKIDPYVEGFMGKLLERLTSLEKKMDSVLSRMGKAAGSAGQVQPPPPPRHQRQMYEAICADCSKVCEVPFQPSESRKVYCKSCWARRKGERPGMPILRQVSLPPKLESKLSAAAHMAAEAAKSLAKKVKKNKPAKKAKKKRK